MRPKLLGVATALAIVLSTVAALAAGMIMNTTVKSIDVTKHLLTVSSGEIFDLPSALTTTDLKPGMKVIIMYDMKGGRMVASKVGPVK